MNFICKAMIIFLLLSNMSCKRSEKIDDNCQSKDDLELVTESFDTSKYRKIDFLISFTHSDSWGKFANRITIFREKMGYKLESSFVLRKRFPLERDTIYFETYLTGEKIDSLLGLINQFRCHPYHIDTFGQTIDGNYKRLVLKNGNLIRGWMWQDGIISRNAKGEKFVDSMKIKALAFEGMLYRLVDRGKPSIVFNFYQCENDSVKMEIFPGWGDYATQSISVKHPKYTFDTNADGYIERKINCLDTISIAKELNIMVTTKELKNVKIENIKKHRE